MGMHEISKTELKELMKEAIDSNKCQIVRILEFPSP